MAESKNTASIKKIPPGTITLTFAGDLILAKCEDQSHRGLFRRYEVLLESFANMSREERLLNYKLLNALMLTSVAKKTSDKEFKKKLFDYKNSIYLSIANDRSLRKKIQFIYLNSKNFRVLSQCRNCSKEKTAHQNPELISNKKFCPDCKVDRNFFDIIVMSHRFHGGQSNLFLSHDQLGKIDNIRFKYRAKLGEVKEETQLDKYRYSAKNMDAFAIDSILDMYNRLS